MLNLRGMRESCLACLRVDEHTHSVLVWHKGVMPGLHVSLPWPIPLVSKDPWLACLLGMRTLGK